MEKKKLLLVSVSVGLFLVIVIGASILVFSPRDYSSSGKSQAVPVSPGTSRAALAPSAAETAQTTEIAQLSEIAQLQGTAAVTASAVATSAASAESGQKNERMLENIIYINGTSAENAVRVERLSDGNTRTVITIPGPHENVITVNAPPTQTPAGSVPPPSDKKTAPQTEVAAASPARPAPPKPATSTSKPTASTGNAGKPQPKPTPAWWVQTNSYSKKAYADNAKKFLESKGITSVVMNGTVGGKTYYRVRVGPYSSQAEADFWLSLIKTIEGMENSLVWKSSGALPTNSL